MKILYYGNCQLAAIKSLLNLKNFVEKIIECFNTEIDEFTFKNIIQQQDIIITQSIHDFYREKEYLSTNYIIKNCKKNCKIIIFDSCYFNFYYFDLTYKMFNDKELHEPIGYHYNSMIDCYKKKIPIYTYINNFVNNINLKTKEELEQIANKSLEELNKRYHENIFKYKINENIFVITACNYIRNNYKEKLLFYSMNHPTKFVFQYLCEEIIKILNIENTIILNKDTLDFTKCIIYKAIQKAVNFDINKCNPLLKNETNIGKITKIYYDTYQKIGFKE